MGTNLVENHTRATTFVAMPRPLPRDANAKRAVLYSDSATDEEKNELALAYIEAERYGEALEFLAMTRDAALLDRIRAAALDLGDTFLLTQVARYHPDGAGDGDWERIEKQATARGRELDAARARRMLGIEDEEEEEEDSGEGEQEGK